jgi:hypothetical protein
MLQHTFTPSASGLGIGVLGAIVGGLAAKEASEAAARSRNHGHSKGRDENHKLGLISTIVGAAVGGLGANALEKRIEMSKEKMKDEQEAREKRWHRDGGSGRGDRDPLGPGRGRSLDDDDDYDSEGDYVYRNRRTRS